MTNKIGIDLSVDPGGLEQGFTAAEKRTQDYARTAKKSMDDVSAAATKSAESIGLSAKQTAAAMRGVPAQFTDIVTALQSGQSPMTVILQQGGQLKDMFGGIGPAARALGGYVAGLISPLSMLAAGAAGLGYAFYAGRQEASAMNQALALTGNYAGQTRGDLITLADAIANSSRMTVGAARESVTALAESGRIGAESFKSATELMVAYQSATGASAAESAKFVIDLFNNPAEGAAKLNEQMHLLTAAQLAHIEALERQGKTTEAQIYLSEQLGQKLSGVTKEVGYLERAWTSMAKAGSSVWQAMKDWGADTTVEAKIKTQTELLNRMKRDAAEGGSGVDYGTAIANAEAKLAALRQQNTVETSNASTAAAEAKKQAAERELQTLRNANSEVYKRQVIKEKIARLKASAPSLSGDELKSNQSAIKGLQKQLDQLDKPDALNEYERLVKAIREKIAVAKLDATQEEQLTESQRMRAKVMSDLEDGTLKLNAVQKQRVLGLLDESVALERKNQADALNKKADLLIRDYQRNNREMVERIQREAELATMTGERRVVAEALYKVEDEGAKIRDRILRDLPEGVAQTRALAEAEAELANQKERVGKAALENYQRQRTFEFGWEKAFRSYEENATNAAKTAESAFNGTTQAMEGLVRNFVRNGEIDFRSFGDAVINTLIDIQMQTLRTQVFAPMMKDAGGFFAKLFGGGGSTDSSVVDYGGDIVSPYYHTGGIVGVDSGSAKRSLQASLWRDAPRYHTGAIAGDEQPAVLRKGEGVFTESQMSKLAPTSPVEVNIMLEPGMNATTSRRQSGGKEILDVLVSSVKSALIGDVASGGDFSASMEGQYGLNRAAGAWGRG